MNEKKNKWVKVGRTLDNGAAAAQNQPGPADSDEDGLAAEDIEEDNNAVAVPSKKRRLDFPE